MELFIEQEKGACPPMVKLVVVLLLGYDLHHSQPMELGFKQMIVSYSPMATLVERRLLGYQIHYSQPSYPRLVIIGFQFCIVVGKAIGFSS